MAARVSIGFGGEIFVVALRLFLYKQRELRNLIGDFATRVEVVFCYLFEANLTSPNTPFQSSATYAMVWGTCGSRTSVSLLQPVGSA